MESYGWVGFAVNAVKYYAFGVESLLFFDYLLTLQDEVQYIWKGRKSWVFFLFLANRYAPMIYVIWSTFALNYAPYTAKVCDKVAMVEFVYLVSVTLLAQIFFIARLYALAGESRKVLITFTFLTITQTTLGVVFMVLGRNAASFLLPTGPRLVCIPDSQSTFNIRVAYSFFSLGYDAISFLTLVRLSYSTCGAHSTWPTILRTVIKGSALYFLAIFGSHFLVVIYMIIVPHGLKYFSSVGISPLAQIMVSRLVLSLRKAADRTIDVTDFIQEELSFCRLPVHTRTRVDSSCSSEGGPFALCDPRYYQLVARSFDVSYSSL